MDASGPIGRDEASLWLERFRADAFLPETLERALDGGVGIDEAFHGCREPFLRRIQDPPPLYDIDPTEESYVTVNGRYFDRQTKYFLPIGYNHNPDWPKLMDSNPSVPKGGIKEARRYDPGVTRRWFHHLAENGVNLVRLMVETPPNGNLENPVGTFQPEAMRWLDNVVSAARSAGVLLMVTPYDTFWMNLRWETTTYSPFRGGPVEKKIDWYLKPELRQAQKRRMRWLIDRYGNLDTIFAWELMNEADLWWGASPTQLHHWADEMVAYVRDYERSKWGRNHLITVSTAEAMPKHELADFAFRRNDLDFATTHLYIGASKAPTDALSVIRTEEQGVRHALSQIRDGRPYLDSENGPIDKWIADTRLDDEVHHAQSWAHLASGGAGSSFRWPYRNPHHLTPGMLETLKGLRTFADAIDWEDLNGEAVASPWKLPKDVAGTSFATSKAMIAFAARKDAGRCQPIEEPRGYRLSLAFDTNCGEWLPSDRLVLDRGIRSAAFLLLAVS